ncbi:uncharacterized protein LOC111010676 [Momordica charantia]|uniref:Uncharacterized protein LOC111010676 n=1 Tax=Momordica charantia TaxID=3673 RepID=A0A6J1CF44_MOMCH|nr:uncharacterized protein LOC111010676 [Momordica charantia]
MLHSQFDRALVALYFFNGRQRFGRWRSIFSRSSFTRSFSPWRQRSYMDYTQVNISDAGSVSRPDAWPRILFQRLLVDSSCYLPGAYNCDPFLAAQLVSFSDWVGFSEESNGRTAVGAKEPR